MRIGQKGYSFFAGETSSMDRSGKKQEENGQIKNGSLFAGNLNMAEDPIAKKKQEAREQAAKLVSDAFARAQVIDDEIAERYRKISDSQAVKKAAQDSIKELDASKEELKEIYGIAPDSQEQKDLELLEKRRDYFKGDGEKPSEEEWKRLKEIDKQGLTEYQQRSLDYDSQKAPYEKEIKTANGVIVEESSAIRSTKLSLLKSRDMVDAAEQADGVLESASKEIIGMLKDEAQEITEEKQKEEEEKLEKRKEEKEEFEERLEEIREKNEQYAPEQSTGAQESSSAADQSRPSGDAQTEQMVSLSTVKNDIQKELEKLMEEMQLTDEDLKGLEVDSSL